MPPLLLDAVGIGDGAQAVRDQEIVNSCFPLFKSLRILYDIDGKLLHIFIHILIYLPGKARYWWRRNFRKTVVPFSPTWSQD
jgi:hypothetical protein